MAYTLEAQTSVSNLTQYKLFIGDDRKNMLFGVTFLFKVGVFFSCPYDRVITHDILRIFNEVIFLLDHVIQ